MQSCGRLTTSSIASASSLNAAMSSASPFTILPCASTATPRTFSSSHSLSFPWSVSSERSSGLMRGLFSRRALIFVEVAVSHCEFNLTSYTTTAHQWLHIAAAVMASLLPWLGDPDTTVLRERKAIEARLAASMSEAPPRRLVQRRIRQSRNAYVKLTVRLPRCFGTGLSRIRGFAAL